jgi:hypothetical protein
MLTMTATTTRWSHAHAHALTHSHSWEQARARALAGPFTMETLQDISRSLMERDDWLAALDLYERVVADVDDNTTTKNNIRSVDAPRLLQGPFDELAVRSRVVRPRAQVQLPQRRVHIWL